MNDRKYFLAGGRSLEIAQAFIAERVAARDNLFAYLQEIGADQAKWDDHQLRAVHFPPGAAVPEGLVLKKDGFHTIGRGKAAGPMRARWQSHKEPSVVAFTTALFPDVTFGWVGPNPEGRGQAVYWATTGKIGDAVVITLPKFVDRVPEDATLLKLSEYWAMVEAAEAAAEAAG